MVLFAGIGGFPKQIRGITIAIATSLAIDAGIGLVLVARRLGLLVLLGRRAGSCRRHDFLVALPLAFCLLSEACSVNQNAEERGVDQA